MDKKIIDKLENEIEHAIIAEAAVGVYEDAVKHRDE